MNIDTSLTIEKIKSWDGVDLHIDDTYINIYLSYPEPAAHTPVTEAFTIFVHPS